LAALKSFLATAARSFALMADKVIRVTAPGTISAAKVTVPSEPVQISKVVVGPQGPAGPAGADGVDGVDGVDGLDGEPGQDGDGALGWVRPQDYGAIADGSSHPLSERYASVAAAQAAYDGAYYFVTSLTQEIDYAASKAAANECFGGDLEQITSYQAVGAGTAAGSDFEIIINAGEPDMDVDQYVGYQLFIKYVSTFEANFTIVSNTARVITVDTDTNIGSDATEYGLGFGEHGDNSGSNKVLYFPAGTYMFDDDTLLIRNLRSGRIEGAGKLVTTLKANDIVMGFDGIWYTSISNMGFWLTGSGGTTCLDLDGNVPGHDYTTRGVQSVTLKDVFCYAAGSPHALSMTRQGGNGGQGSECAFINCHLQGASFACYYQSGFNALANQFFGGNFQDYTTHGIYVVGGTFSVYAAGFQSTHYYEQYVNDGYDIRCGESGAFEGCSVYGCRTEGPRFLNNDGSVCVDIRACKGQPATGQWFETTAYSTAVEGREWVRVTSSDGYGTYMVATTPGTSAAGSEPTWPAYASGGTVVDGTVTWTETSFPFIDNDFGPIDYASSSDRGGGIAVGEPIQSFKNVTPASTARERRFQPNDAYIQADASGGAVDVTLPLRENKERGRTCTVLRRDTSTNAINVNNSLGSPETGNTTLVMPAGRYGYRGYVHGQDSGGSERWLLVNTRFLADMIAPTPTTIGALTVTNYISVNDGAGGTIKLAVVSS
jgi:hypothetical protein